MLVTVIMLCGLPASGKSTYREILRNILELSRNPYNVISFDDIHKSLERDIDASFSVIRDIAMKKGMADYKNALDFADRESTDIAVIIDATNTTIKARAKFIKISKEVLTVDSSFVAVHINTPLDICLDRNSKRDEKTRVPVDVIQHMQNIWQEPTLDEGFNVVKVLYEENIE